MKVVFSIVFTIYQLALFAQPANDDCGNAQVIALSADINNCTTWAGSDLNLATFSGVPASSCGGTPNDDIWFTFVATGSDVILGADDSWGVDIVHAVYSGTCGALTEIACSDWPNYSVLSGLTVGASYYLRVYSNSNINHPFSDIWVCAGLNTPPPSNDLCANAINLTPSIDGICTAPYTGTNSTALQTAMPSCNPAFDAQDDVWFTFTATEEIHAVELSPQTGSPPNFECEVYTGSCGALTIFQCQGQFLTGLTIGQTYYVRVFENSTYLGTDPFTICITSPPPCNGLLPPPHDFCAFATPLNTFSGYCGTTLNSYTPDEMTNFCIDGQSASVENNSWLTFTASETDVSIKYWIAGECLSTGGMQYAAFSGVCGSLVELPQSCVNPTGYYGQSGFLNLNNLIIGQQYYIMIDGYAGDVCPYVWQAVSGIVVLGVELNSFDAQINQESNVDITWSTINELNNSHFTVERSSNGAEWQDIETVNGAGNSINQLISYQLTDRINQNGSGVLYYRLKQTDFDGLYSYSFIKSVKYNSQGVEVLYSPENRLLSIFIDEEVVGLEIINTIGNSVLETKFNQTIQVENLSDGFYFIRLTTKKKEHLVKCRVY